MNQYSQRKYHWYNEIQQRRHPEKVTNCFGFGNMM
jgi:hypothetical protein